jgi:hypothetical protein
MEIKIEYYVVILLIASLGFFFIMGTWFKMDEAEMYRNLLLTIAVVHFVMLRLFTIKKQ